jgi:2-polyprenyl-3-methyl-5-hydroxy-6-metoxy-1,4-benzoquinol methylase
MILQCPCCGSKTETITSAPDRNWRVDHTVFQIRRCIACDYRYTANPPVDLGKYYTGGHYSRADMARDLSPYLAGERYKLDIVRSCVAAGNLLEIGPSMGAFCQLAKSDGFNVSAIELDMGCVDFLNTTVGIRAIQSDSPQSVMDSEKRLYDVITMWHALEHMARPWDVVAAAARWLKPGGVLVVAVPNPDSVQAKWMGSRWPHYDLPRHLSHISVRWLTTTAQSAGLVRESITTRDPGSLSVTTQSIPLWLLGTLGISAENGGLSRILASLCWRSGRLLARLAAPFDAREGKGAAYTAVFRRTG